MERHLRPAHPLWVRGLFNFKFNYCHNTFSVFDRFPFSRLLTCSHHRYRCLCRIILVPCAMPLKQVTGVVVADFDLIVFIPVNEFCALRFRDKHLIRTIAPKKANTDLKERKRAIENGRSESLYRFCICPQSTVFVRSAGNRVKI